MTMKITKQETISGDKLWNANYCKVMVANFSLFFAFYLLTPLLPLYPGMSARQRKLSDIPANHTLSFYAEENLKVPMMGGSLEMVAGVRAATMPGLPSDYAMHGRFYADPRFNVGFNFPRFGLCGLPTFFRLSTGWGMHTKNPTMEQLFPDKVYMDLVELNYYHDNPDYRRIRLMTYIRGRLLSQTGIDSMEADIRHHNITVRFDGSQQTTDSIRALITRIGYTPVGACRCGKGAYAYFLIPADQAIPQTIDRVKAIKGVHDANVSSMRKSLAVKYHHQELTEEQLLAALQQAGIQAALPKPHQCSEKK